MRRGHLAPTVTRVDRPRGSNSDDTTAGQDISPAAAPLALPPAEIIKLGQMLQELGEVLRQDSGKPSKPWRRRVRRVLAGTASAIGGVTTWAGQLQEQYPSNWSGWYSYTALLPLIQDGFPVLWVPDASTLHAMAEQQDRKSRQQILLDLRAEVLDHAGVILAQVTAPDLADDRLLVEQALACIVDSPYPAQLAALVVATNRAQAEVGAVRLADLARAGHTARKVPFLDRVQDLRASLMLTALAPALEHFHPNKAEPVPDRPNRHAAVHLASAVQFTPGNALEAVVLAVSVLRQAQANREGRGNEAPSL